MLHNMVKSVYTTARDASQVEILVGIDDDDHETIAKAKLLEERYGLRQFIRPQSKQLNQDYLNWMYPSSNGKYIIVCNDDCQFVTNQWDARLLARIEQYLKDKPDGVIYGYLSDHLLDREYGLSYTCFPLLSRPGINALGFMMHGCFNSWGADIAIFRVYMAVDRVCNLSEVTVEHISHHAGKRERDEISHYVERISAEKIIKPLELDISVDVQRLNNFIGRR